MYKLHKLVQASSTHFEVSAIFVFLFVKNRVVPTADENSATLPRILISSQVSEQSHICIALIIQHHLGTPPMSDGGHFYLNKLASYCALHKH